MYNAQFKSLKPFVFLLLMAFASCKKNDFLLEKNAEDFFHLENKGAQMPVWVEGNTASKNFLIHVHGGPGGESLLSFNLAGKAFTDPLEAQYANVYYDQRGSGSSQGGNDSDLFTEAQFAEDLYKLVRLLKTKYGEDIKVFLIGTSWGGRLCASYLLNPNYQAEIQGWISVAGAINMITTANSGRALINKYSTLSINAGLQVSDWQEIHDWSENIDTITTEEEWGVQNSFGWDAMALLEDSLAHETKIELGKTLKAAFFSPVNLSSVLAQSGAFPEDKLDIFNNLGNSLNSINIPALFMAGKYDFVVPPEVANQAFNAVSSTTKELFIFEKSGHLIPFNQTDLFVKKVIEFVEANQ